jgi:endonuclease G
LHSCHRGSGNRTDDWEYDPKIPTQYQPRLYSSYGSYTRGHQLPSSSRNKTKDINRATFYFSNMTPQTSTFNSGVWAKLEGSVQDNVCSDTLYVVSGAIFDGQHDSSVNVTTTDKSGNVCAVPSHYYKALLRTKSGSTGKAIRSINKAEDLQAIAILMKHVDYSTTLQSSDIISIEELEEITGVTFFPSINDAIEKEVKKQKNRSAWKNL